MVFAAVSSEENKESGLLLSSSGSSNSATCEREPTCLVHVKDGTKLIFVSLCFVCHLSIVHDQDTIGVHHCVDAVGDGEHGALVEGIFDGFLDQSVGL